MNYPNFFIVGAPKCGTTALSEYLRTHPQVFMSTPKEPHYLAHDFPHYKEQLPTLEAYLDLFEDASPEHVAIGEASVWYLFSKEALSEIRTFCPKARIIAMLRNPVDLVQSIHSQLLWVLDEDLKEFSTAWRLQEERKQGSCLPGSCREPAFLQYGDVAKLGAQMQRLIEIFPKDQIKVIFHDDMKRDILAVYREVLNFLCLKYDGRTAFPKINENKYNHSVRLARLTHRPPQLFVLVLTKFKKLFGIKSLGWRERLQALNYSVRSRPKLDEDLHKELVSYFRQDIKLLEQLTERDLSAWLSHTRPHKRIELTCPSGTNG